MASKKSTIEIPQLPQKITVNCKKLDEKQLLFLSKALHSKTKIMFIDGPAGSTKTYMAVYSALRLLSAKDELDLLSKLLVFNPKRRIKVEEALNHPYLEALHIPEDEPIREPIHPLEFEFEKHRLNKE